MSLLAGNSSLRISLTVYTALTTTPPPFPLPLTPAQLHQLPAPLVVPQRRHERHVQPQSGQRRGHVAGRAAGVGRPGAHLVAGEALLVRDKVCGGEGCRRPGGPEVERGAGVDCGVGLWDCGLRVQVLTPCYVHSGTCQVLYWPVFRWTTGEL